MQSLGSADYFQCIWCRSNPSIISIKHIAWSSTPTIITSEFEKGLFFINKVNVPKLSPRTQQLISQNNEDTPVKMIWVNDLFCKLPVNDIHMTQLEFILLSCHSKKKQGFLYSIFVSVCSVTTSCSFSSNTLLITSHILYNQTDTNQIYQGKEEKKKALQFNSCCEMHIHTHCKTSRNKHWS